MKKIYALAISLLLGNIWIVLATTPQRSTNQHPLKDVHKNNSVSEKAIDFNINLHSTYGSKGFTPSISRAPFQSKKTTSQACIFEDNFDGANDTAALKLRGYKTYYRGGGPPGTSPEWFQGNATLFSSYNGPADGYLASNYNSVTLANNIDNWLVLPSLSLDSGDAISFYSRSPLASTFPDSLHVWYSANGDSLPEDTSWVLLGEFLVNIDGAWEYNEYSIPVASANGRLAIRYAVVDGGPDGLNSNFIGIDELLVFTPSNEDANLFSIVSPKSGCSLSATESVTVSIKNNGSGPITSFDVSYTLDSGTAVIEGAADIILPGEEYFYTFGVTADLSGLGVHYIEASVIIPNDSNLCNDVNSTTIQNLTTSNPLTTAYKMGFESNENFSSWVVEDVDVDGVSWDTVNTYTYTGLSCIRKAGSAHDDNDWIFTGCLEMIGGTSYTLDYWYKNFDLVSPCNLETYIGSSPTNSAMTQLLTQDPVPADTTYQHSIKTFTVPNSGVYYIGFHAYSSLGSGSSSMRIDDINLDNGNFIGINENPALRNVDIFPNPGNGIFYLNSNKSSRNNSVDIYNISGQKVYSSQLNNLHQQRIDLSKQSNGVYTIRITSDSYVENHSLIINK